MIRYRSTCGILCQFVMYIFIIMTSCVNRSNVVEGFSDYYLPFESFDQGGMEYRYRSLADSTLEHEVWHHIKTSEEHILSINYDHRQQVVQKQYEHVVGNGVLIDSLHLFFYDSLGRTISLPVRVLSPHRLPFNPVDSAQLWLTKLEWWQPTDQLHVVLERRRRFLGGTTWKWQGKTIPAVRFKTVDKFETERDGWTTSEWDGEEVYAKGIGLIYYRRNISPQMVLEFELDSRKPIIK